MREPTTLAITITISILHHGARLAARVVRLHVLELLHVLLHTAHLGLQLRAQRWQRVADVIRELLTQVTLQVRRAHPLGDMPMTPIPDTHQ